MRWVCVGGSLRGAGRFLLTQADRPISTGVLSAHRNEIRSGFDTRYGQQQRTQQVHGRCA
jgi:hypothetical protein